MIPTPEPSLTKGLGPALIKDPTGDRIIGTSLFDADREFPQLSLSESALTQNIAAMAAYIADRGVHLAPHGKTAMSPVLAQRQLDAGAWAITAATPTQLRVYRHFGISRLYLANQLVEPSAIQWLRDELDGDARFDCFITVDSIAGLNLLADVPFDAAHQRPINIMLEVGHAGGRTGTRTSEELVELARAATRTPGVRVAGITNYEGTLGGDSPTEAAERVYEFARSLGELVKLLEADDLLSSTSWISIGGSGYFEEAFRGLSSGGIAPARIVLRSGAYLTHDNGLYSRISPSSREVTATPSFSSAIRVWAPILSLPEPGLALLLCGRRDVGFDQDLPAVLGTRTRAGADPTPFTATVTQLADQHAFVTFDPGQFAGRDAPKVGDLVELGISHPCTTLDRWGLVPVVDDELRVRELIRMYFS